MAILEEYTTENGMHIAWHDDFIVSDEEKAILLKQAAEIYTAAAVNAENNVEKNGQKSNVCDLSS